MRNEGKFTVLLTAALSLIMNLKSSTWNSSSHSVLKPKH